MERALLQGEREAELEQIEAETDVITQLQHKLDDLESAIHREKDKVEAAVDKGSGKCFYLNPPITLKDKGFKCYFSLCRLFDTKRIHTNTHCLVSYTVFLGLLHSLHVCLHMSALLSVPSFPDFYLLLLLQMIMEF